MMQAALTGIREVETNRKSTVRESAAPVYRHSPDGIGTVIPDRAGQAKRRQAGNWGKP
jgi:hypothetical protein